MAGVQHLLVGDLTSRRRAGVLVNVQSALEDHLKKKVTLGSDIRLVMVRVDAGIECTVSTITSGTKETTSYFVAFDEAESGTPIYRLEIMSDKIIDKIVRVVVIPSITHGLSSFAPGERPRAAARLSGPPASHSQGRDIGGGLPLSVHFSTEA